MTTAYALVAPLRLGEDAKRVVRSLGIGRTDLKVGRRDNLVLIPIQNPIEPPFPESFVEVAEFVSSKPPKTYKDVVQVPERFRQQLPTGFDIVGDLVVIKIPEPLRLFGPAIGEAILRVHKNVKGVFHDDGVQGERRLRTLRHLSGEARTRTRHIEYGVEFEVDLAKAYFSPRLANEHDRVAKLVQLGETVVDCTAGVGPFTVMIARLRKADKVYAIDVNPDAVALLRENVRIHHLEDRVEVLEGDAATALGPVPSVDRAIINLPHGGEAILDAAVAKLKPNGVAHYYRIVDQAQKEAHIGQTLARVKAGTSRDVRVEAQRVVHAYSASDRLFAFDLRVA